MLFLLSSYWIVTVRGKAKHYYYNIHNLLDAIVAGDYSFRGLSRDTEGAYEELIGTINSLARLLQKQRLKSEESQLLLQKVVDQYDVAIIAWDQNDRINLTNPAARALLDIDNDVSLSEDALSNLSHNGHQQLLELINQMRVGETRVEYLEFRSIKGRFRLHLERFFESGYTHSLLFLTDVSSILRLEELKAWRSLVRVISHEINNSLAPLKSLSDTLKKQVEKREKDPILGKELVDGISIIANRAESITRFVDRYNSVPVLPAPNKSTIELKRLIEDLVKLFPHEEIRINGDPVALNLDSSQIEQTFINLLKNSSEANEIYYTHRDEKRGPIVFEWAVEGSKVIVKITDSGGGIEDPENLFTPFYTTKPSGTGVGLVFCQQVIEGHNGSIALKNLDKRHGTLVLIELPIV